MSDPSNKWTSSNDTIPMLSNQQDQRKKPRRKIAIFVTALPLFLHVLFVAAIVSFLCLYLDGRNFGIHHRDRFDDVMPEQRAKNDIKLSLFKHWSPLQTDMITTLSVLLVATRFFLMSWCIDIAWKCMFIILEQTGLSISQMRDLIKYKVLLRSGLPKDGAPSGMGLHYFLVVLVLVLPFPAQFSSPLISGSITWIPTYDYVPGAAVSVIPTFAGGSGWNRYQAMSPVCDEVISPAGQLHRWLYTSSNDNALKRSLDTAVPRKLAPGSTIVNITMPFFSLSNWKWIHDIDVVPPDQRKVVEDENGRLNVTETSLEKLLGGFALIPPRRWEQANRISNSTYDFEEPPAVKMSQQLYIAWWPWGTDKSSPDCYDSYTLAGVTTPDPAPQYTEQGYICYQFATVDVIAGGKECRECPIQNSLAVSVDESYLAQVPLEPDQLVNEALALTPQTIRYLLESQTQYYLPNQVESDLVDYLQIIIRRAYIMSWNSLATYMANREDDRTSSDVNIGVESTKAVVSFLRVYIWIGCQALAWVAAGIFTYVQHRCKRPLAADTIMAALFMDRDDKLREEIKASGLSDVVAISSKKHNKRLGVLKLEFDPEDNHSYLTKRRPIQGVDHEEES